LAISREKNKQQRKSRGSIPMAPRPDSGGNQPNQNCNKNSIVAVTPEINTNFGASCRRQNKFWRILPHKFK
jgi:hypothetical protein